MLTHDGLDEQKGRTCKVAYSSGKYEPRDDQGEVSEFVNRTAIMDGSFIDGSMCVVVRSLCGAGANCRMQSKCVICMCRRIPGPRRTVAGGLWPATQLSRRDLRPATRPLRRETRLSPRARCPGACPLSSSRSHPPPHNHRF